jgi:hypothetical protein
LFERASDSGHQPQPSVSEEDEDLDISGLETKTMLLNVYDFLKGIKRDANKQK